MRAHCCESWTKALLWGTDNEHYGSLITAKVPLTWEGDVEMEPGFYAGNVVLTRVRFCPWCGTEVGPPDNEDLAFKPTEYDGLKLG